MRVRARPFTSDSFHGNNPQVTCIQCCTPLFDLLGLVSMQDAVLSIPCRPEWDRAASAFDEADQSHRGQLRIALSSLQERHSSLSAIFVVESRKSADTLYASHCESACRPENTVLDTP